MKRIVRCQDAPLESELAVLDLLYSRWGDHTRRKIQCPHRYRREGPQVEIEHFYKDGDLAEVDVFVVAPDLPDRLLTQHLVRGKPEWGYTDLSQLSISEHGTRVLWAERERLGIGDLTVLGWFEYARWHVPMLTGSTE